MTQGDKQEYLLAEEHNDSEQSQQIAPEQPSLASQIPFAVYIIILVEICERFSYYSLRACLVLFLEEKLGFDEDKAKAYYSYFCSIAYFCPLLGSFLADSCLGRYTTISTMTFLYCIGAYLLCYAAHEASRLFTLIALILIAIGTGSIKPNVSAFGANQIISGDPGVIASYFSLFYMSINVGSIFSTLLIPMVREKYSFFVAFLFPAGFLTLGLIIFVLGKNVYVHNTVSQSLYARIIKIIYAASSEKKHVKSLSIQQPTRALGSKCSRRRQINDNGLGSVQQTSIAEQFAPPQLHNNAIVEQEQVPTDYKPSFFDYAKLRYEAQHVEEIKSVFKLLPIFPFIIFFWMAFDQQGSTFILQAKKMNRKVFGYEILAPQVTVLNSFSILILVPLCDRLLYPFLRRTFGLQLKHLNRVLCGMLFTAAAFASCAFLDYKIARSEPQSVSIVYQVPQYIALACAELLISVSGLEFVYSQAPKSFKSTLGSFWNVCVAIADTVAGLIFSFVHLKPENQWQLSALFGLILVVDFFAFLPVAIWYNRQPNIIEFYDDFQQEFLHPGSTKEKQALKVSMTPPETPFEALTDEERDALLHEESFTDRPSSYVYSSF